MVHYNLTVAAKIRASSLPNAFTMMKRAYIRIPTKVRAMAWKVAVTPRRYPKLLSAARAGSVFFGAIAKAAMRVQQNGVKGRSHEWHASLRNQGYVVLHVLFLHFMPSRIRSFLPRVESTVAVF
jgi:hypothetical protein